MNIPVKIIAVSDRYIPQYKTDGAACADAVACLQDRLMIPPKTVAKVPLGFSIALPLGWEMQIRSRSGHASKGIIVANGIGTIDSDYRGPVTTLLYNSTNESFFVEDGDRVAQVSIQPTPRIVWERAEFLEQTVRGDGGFGSTGNK